MWIVLDGAMAIAALQVAVHAGAEDAGIHAYIVPGGVLHAFVPVAAEAIEIRLRDARYSENQKRPKS